MAMSLSGSPQRASVVINAVTAYPCSFWIQAMHNSVANSASALSYNYTGAAERRIEIEIRGDIAGDPVRLRNGNQTGIVTAIASSNSYSANVWSRIGIRNNSTSDSSIFLNGTKTSSASNAAFPATQPNELNLGSSASGGTYADFLTGGVAMVAMWSVGLTDAEFESLNKGFSPSMIRPQSLKFYAPLLRSFIDIRNSVVLNLSGSPTVRDHPASYGL